MLQKERNTEGIKTSPAAIIYNYRFVPHKNVRRDNR